jgi:hypothetical protein
MARHASISFQGVDPGAYPADLSGYIIEGGSEGCADSMGVAVEAYANACPDSKIVISGWRYGRHYANINLDLIWTDLFCVAKGACALAKASTGSAMLVTTSPPSSALATQRASGRIPSAFLHCHPVLPILVSVVPPRSTPYAAASPTIGRLMHRESSTT